ncbi:hypothetical protein [Streptomyces sp. NPDC058623]|uniref:hypothetical protein n=1 Tax=Streptomyces sp. NPDC058623 TaxID=3346563 RepID=UPI00365C0255
MPATLAVGTDNTAQLDGDIVARSRALALLAATATAATLAGAAPHSSAPSTTWNQVCPDASARLTEAPGWESAYAAFSNPAGTCTVIRNTSPAIFWISVQSPDTVVLVDGAVEGGDPTVRLLAQTGAVAAGKRSDTALQQPVLRNGDVVIQHRPGSPYWIQAADASTQVRTEFAITLSRFAYAGLSPGRWFTAWLTLDEHVQRCATAADTLRKDLIAEGQAVTYEAIFDQLETAGRTAAACKRVYDAAKPPDLNLPSLRTPQAQEARSTLRTSTSQADDVAKWIARGKIVLKATPWG